ncbi:MAG: T9SS type A sorting domain-containing protein, partial [Bacteroidota bacterium]
IQSGLYENQNNEVHISNISKSGIINLEGSLHEVKRVEIINPEGKIIYSSSSINNTIPLNANSNGMYLLNIHYEKFIRPIKFVFSR